jgi:hypothetical protein
MKLVRIWLQSADRPVVADDSVERYEHARSMQGLKRSVRAAHAALFRLSLELARHQKTQLRKHVRQVEKLVGRTHKPSMIRLVRRARLRARDRADRRRQARESLTR